MCQLTCASSLTPLGSPRTPPGGLPQGDEDEEDPDDDVAGDEDTDPDLLSDILRAWR